MSKKTNKRQVTIFDSKTGVARLSEPVAVRTPRWRDASAEVTAATPLTEQPLTPFVDAEAGPVVASGATEEQSKPSERDDALTLPPTSSGESTNKGERKGSVGGKPKADIQTLEQFIAYAFGRKGQRVKLTPKSERLIAQNLRLDDEVMNRLLSLADTDAQLAVPRQLLLVCREVEGSPALRAAISGFVATVMQRHPVFADEGVRAALRHLPEAPSIEVALKHVLSYEPPSVSGKERPKPAELQALRHNALYLMTTWLASSRGLSLEDLSNLLFQVLWAPAARELDDDNARLRALTEIEQPAGVGVACDKFRQNLIGAVTARDQAQREASVLRESVAELRTQLEKAEAERNALASELKELKLRSESELAELRKQHEIERTHLRHDQEQLRGRLVHRLSESIEMLEVGLTALRNKTPRTEVMVERAEHVIDALRAEESNLREE